jgi:hypothetical protein
LLPKTIVADQAATMVIAVDAPQGMQGAALTIDAPPGFSVSPDSFALGMLNRKDVRRAVVVRKAGASPPDGDQALVVRLSANDGGSSTVAAQTVTFSFASQISTVTYLVLGALGIGVGYILRFFVNILKAIPPPSPAPPLAGEPAIGPISTWVASHYYFVDCLITFGLAFVALVALMQGSRPPQTAWAWPHALTLGVSLGLLTNSELFTRIR